MKINGNIIEIVNYRRDKAFETLDDIQKLLKDNMLALAMNRVYYSGFYIVSALSLLDNKKFSKHKMLIGYFNKEYLKSAFVDRKLGRILNDSYERRNALDYHDFATVTKSEIKEYLMNMKGFVKEIDKIIQEKISNLQ